MVNNTTKPEQLSCIVHDLVTQCLKSACVEMSGKRRTSDLNVTGSRPLAATQLKSLVQCTLFIT